VADVLAVGESLGLLSPARAESFELASDVRLGIGGAESNVAIGVSRLGGSAAWVGRVGDDDLGRRIVRELRAEAVQAHMIVDDVASTAVMLKEHRPIGPSRVRYYRRGSAGSRLRPDDIDEHLVAAASVVHVTGITPSLSETADEAVTHALALAAAHGVPVSFDVNHRSTVFRHRDAAEIYSAIAERSTIVFAGEEEAALLVPGARTRIDLVRGMRDLGPTEAVLKLGDEGCLASIGDDLFELPAVCVAVVDTVGAGDAFVAGYLADRARGASTADRLVTATRCGAFACTSFGDWEGAARRSDLSALEVGGDPVHR